MLTQINEDVARARRLAVSMLREGAEGEWDVGFACHMARRYLASKGLPVPDDVIAFATAGKHRESDVPP